MKIPSYLVHKLNTARRLVQQADDLQKEFENFLLEQGLELEEIQGGRNSENFAEMISCYVLYGEDDIEEIIDIIQDLEVGK